jgi:hypothetical protein
MVWFYLSNDNGKKDKKLNTKTWQKKNFSGEQKKEK